MHMEVTKRCFIMIEKKQAGLGSYYLIKIVTENSRIAIVADEIDIDDRRPKPITALTNFATKR